MKSLQSYSSVLQTQRILLYNPNKFVNWWLEKTTFLSSNNSHGFYKEILFRIKSNQIERFYKLFTDEKKKDFTQTSVPSINLLQEKCLLSPFFIFFRLIITPNSFSTKILMIKTNKYKIVNLLSLVLYQPPPIKEQRQQS